MIDFVPCPKKHSHSPNVDWMLYGALPICVLINYRGENLIKMVAVRTSHICPQNLWPSIALDAVLNIARIEYEIGLGSSDAHQ